MWERFRPIEDWTSNRWNETMSPISDWKSRLSRAQCRTSRCAHTKMPHIEVTFLTNFGVVAGEFRNLQNLEKKKVWNFLPKRDSGAEDRISWILIIEKKDNTIKYSDISFTSICHSFILFIDISPLRVLFK